MFNFCVMCVTALPACMSVFWNQRPENGVRSPGTGDIESCEPLCVGISGKVRSSARAASALNH